VNHAPIATFFGGVMPASAEEQELAYHVGRELGTLGFTLRHGGYNGLMEYAARGAASVGARVVAVTLAGKEEWGEFNPHVDESIHTPDMGTRLAQLVDRADVIVGMGGGVGSLHELTAAIWYAGNIRHTPVILAGQTAARLLAFLKHERWLYESPTRPLDFLHTSQTAAEFRRVLLGLPLPSRSHRNGGVRSLDERIRQAAFVHGPYHLANGWVLSNYFDPFRLAADPVLSSDLADAMARRLRNPPDVVVGMALGGVALAANLSQVLARPLMIARPRPKEYGTFAQLEGIAQRGQRALLVDDVVRSGRQMLGAIRSLEDAGLVISEAMCVLDRSGSGRRSLHEHGVCLQSMLSDMHADTGSDLDTVSGVAG
jgi:uncharacterized protein (TIGR00725 family)